MGRYSGSARQGSAKGFRLAKGEPYCPVLLGMVDVAYTVVSRLKGRLLYQRLCSEPGAEPGRVAERRELLETRAASLELASLELWVDALWYCCAVKHRAAKREAQLPRWFPAPASEYIGMLRAL